MVTRRQVIAQLVGGLVGGLAAQRQEGASLAGTDPRLGCSLAAFL